MIKNSLIYLIALLLTVLSGCSVAERPVLDRNSPEYQMVLERLYSQRKEMAADVSYREYMENKD